MLDVEAIDAEVKEISGVTDYSFGFDENKEEYGFSYIDSDGDLMFSSIDQTATEVLSRDELVTFLLQFVMSRMESSKMMTYTITRGALPTVLVAISLGIVLGLLPEGILWFLVFLAGITIAAFMLIITGRNIKLKMQSLGDLATYKIRPNLVEVLQKLSIHSKTEAKRTRYQKRVDALASLNQPAV